VTIINQTKKSSAGEPFVFGVFFLFTSGTPDIWLVNSFLKKGLRVFLPGKENSTLNLNKFFRQTEEQICNHLKP
jgi:hypothetical protein